MMTIITPVGTSLFTNYLKKRNNIKEHLDAIKGKPAEEYKLCEDRINRIKQTIIEFIKENNSSASAEIKSILKIKEEIKDKMDVRLFASDSLESVLAAEILSDNVSNAHFNKEQDVIKGLQVNDGGKFAKQGMKNLINRIYAISPDYFENLILNITGGFKATIPFLTIFGQVNNISLYYIFEESDTLIKIPQVPISIDWKIFDDNKDLFSQIERDGIKIKEYPHSCDHQIEAILEREDNLICFNSLGIILWEKYKSRYEIFYVFSETQKKLEQFNDAEKKTIYESLRELSKRLKENPSDSDLKHSLPNTNLPDKFYCFKHKEDRKQIRILWHSKERLISYGSKVNDIYIASFWSGKEVHNAESEYISEIDKFGKLNPDLKQKLSEFKPIRIDKIDKKEAR